MKRSLFALATVCALAVVAYACRAWDFVTDFGAKLLAGPVDLHQVAEVAPRRQITAAHQFVLRLIRRDRPLISADWRMVPSV